MVKVTVRGGCGWNDRDLPVVETIFAPSAEEALQALARDWQVPVERLFEAVDETICIGWGGRYEPYIAAEPLPGWEVYDYSAWGDPVYADTNCAPDPFVDPEDAPGAIWEPYYVCITVTEEAEG